MLPKYGKRRFANRAFRFSFEHRVRSDLITHRLCQSNRRSGKNAEGFMHKAARQMRRMAGLNSGAER
ncbi:hypothetical protein K788_00000900 [Paraburkholderia caribensis MBA4]|uniref:Uncharacterized protein n=1 Tax=Paraburkholderia caribensis MBA4 TaxID=1323664 RepID=A0A0P0RJ77_9BURK|nr:hypothetical protein K788_00000900 [Paraburkholderia caribensis MBA4]